MPTAWRCSATSRRSDHAALPIIPCLLLHGGGRSETRPFGDPKYVGDPLNAVKIFNRKGSTS